MYWQDLHNKNIGYLQKVLEFWCLWIAWATLLYCNAFFLTKFVISVQLHPDLNPGDSSSHAKFVRLNEAYSVLSNLQARREYDLQFMWSTRAPQRSQPHHVDPRYSRRSASPYASYHRFESRWSFFLICFIYVCILTSLVWRCQHSYVACCRSTLDTRRLLQISNLAN